MHLCIIYPITTNVMLPFSDNVKPNSLISYFIKPWNKQVSIIIHIQTYCLWPLKLWGQLTPSRPIKNFKKAKNYQQQVHTHRTKLEGLSAKLPTAQKSFGTDTFNCIQHTVKSNICRSSQTFSCEEEMVSLQAVNVWTHKHIHAYNTRNDSAWSKPITGTWISRDLKVTWEH